MPTIFYAAGFRFMIYVHDHAPAHVHVIGHGATVELNIDPVALRAVRGSLTDSQIRHIIQIARRREPELLAAWQTHHG